jgi:hypothetical protein
MIRYGFNIRTRTGQRVDNIHIMAASMVDAERRLRQMYLMCEIIDRREQLVHATSRRHPGRARGPLAVKDKVGAKKPIVVYSATRLSAGYTGASIAPPRVGRAGRLRPECGAMVDAAGASRRRNDSRKSGYSW